MTTQETNKERSSARVEMFLRTSRRALVVVLLFVFILEATVIAVAFWPATWLAEWPMRFPLAFPIFVLLAFMALRLMRDGRELRANAPEAKVVLNDEFRQANLLRAQRWAFILILIAQLPLGLLFMRVPVTRAVLGMGGTTIALGMSAVILLLLFFDRE
ncbi:MAG: hypothetical protein ACM3JB_14820 [Acidobacteriaceae bacterium]